MSKLHKRSRALLLALLIFICFVPSGDSHKEPVVYAAKRPTQEDIDNYGLSFTIISMGAV